MNEHYNIEHKQVVCTKECCTLHLDILRRSQLAEKDYSFDSGVVGKQQGVRNTHAFHARVIRRAFPTIHRPFEIF